MDASRTGDPPTAFTDPQQIQEDFMALPSRPRLMTDPVTRAELREAVKKQPLNTFLKSPAQTTTLGLLVFGKWVSDKIGLTKFARPKPSACDATREMPNALDETLVRPRAASVSVSLFRGPRSTTTLDAPASPPPSPPSAERQFVAYSKRSDAVVGGIMIMIGLAGLCATVTTVSSVTLPANVAQSREPSTEVERHLHVPNAARRELLFDQHDQYVARHAHAHAITGRDTGRELLFHGHTPHGHTPHGHTPHGHTPYCPSPPPSLSNDVPVPNPVWDWYDDKKATWSTANMCLCTQYNKGSPWSSFGSDNFFTVAIKAVLVSDVLSELYFINTDSSQDGPQGARYFQAFTVALTVLGEISNAIILVVVTVNVILSGVGQTMSVYDWSGYLGCFGAMQSFILPSFFCAVFFPVMTLAVAASMRGDSGQDNTEEKAKGSACAALFFCAIFGPPSVGFVIYIFGGIPMLFPLLGFVLMAALTACAAILILSLPDILLSRLSGGEAMPEEAMYMKLALGIVFTVVLCAPRSAMAWDSSVGIGGSYKFTFTTLGAMPVKEEFDHHGINLILGGPDQDTTVYSTSIQVAAWTTLGKLAIQLVILSWKFISAGCKCF